MNEQELHKMKLNIAYQAIKIKALEEAIFKSNPELSNLWKQINDQSQLDMQDYLAELAKKAGT